MIDLDHHYNAILTALHSQLEVEYDLASEQGKHWPDPVSSVRCL